MIDPGTALAFALFENRNVFALVLGSGVSRAASIPTGWEVILDLSRRLGHLEGVGEQPDWAAWYRGRFNEEPSYARLIDALAPTKAERRSILHTMIEPSAEDREAGRKVPTKAHRAIARLVRDGFVRVIITTNFDRLMESALQAEGVEPTVIRSDDDLQGAIPLIHARCFVLKVHGDYLDARLRNTEGELETYSPALDALLDRIIDEHGLIVCGWSADWDTALRAAITRAPSRRFPLFWASRGEPSRIASDVIAARAGRVIRIADSDSFFEDLERKVAAQTALQRPNPLSVELLAAAAKRYLARPEHRIELADLVRDEARRAREAIKGAGFSADVAWIPDEFQRRVQRYETAMAPLLRLFLLMGQWGDDSEQSLTQDTIRAFTALPSLGGTTIWVGLRLYPAVLLMYAYGIGLAKARRYSALLRWLSTAFRPVAHTEPELLVQRLFLSSWADMDQNAWKSLPGFDRRKTPISDHLLEVFQPVLERELVGEDATTFAFETFEVLSSSAYLTLGVDEVRLQNAMASSGSDAWVWVPVGRSAWNSEVRNAIFADMNEPEVCAALLKAGFFHASGNFMTLALDNLRRVMGKFNFW
ncbi:SIR2 family protein [Roseomonas sp. CCTCC AB2023176]|uniref:SIR2 family protein n=1 Tax=Roseomonas sp. CCTCC AB2023176 TaxID=3342640 RepID=UPI0035DC2B81